MSLGHSETELNGEREVLSIRQRLRREMEEALLPPKLAARLADIEREAGRKSATASSAAKHHVSLQTAEPNLEDLLREDKPVQPIKPFMSGERLRMPGVVPDRSGKAKELKTDVQAFRQRLSSLDSETTKLTTALRRNRKILWEHQRVLCLSEVRIDEALRKHANGGMDSASEEDHLIQEEQHLAQEVAKARERASKWCTVAKKQDAMLQQDKREARGSEAQQILARHPAGVVFLPPMPSDESSDEGMPLRSPRSALRAGGMHEDSSDDDDDDDFEPRHLPGVGEPLPGTLRHPSGGPAPPPPPPVPQWRTLVDAGQQDDSGSSAKTSPSGDSAGRPSPMGDHVNHLRGKFAHNSGAHSGSSDDESEDDPHPIASRAMGNGAVPPLPGAGATRDALLVDMDPEAPTSRSV